MLIRESVGLTISLVHVAASVAVSRLMLVWLLATAETAGQTSVRSLWTMAATAATAMATGEGQQSVSVSQCLSAVLVAAAAAGLEFCCACLVQRDTHSRFPFLFARSSCCSSGERRSRRLCQQQLLRAAQSMAQSVYVPVTSTRLQWCR